MGIMIDIINRNTGDVKSVYKEKRLKSTKAHVKESPLALLFLDEFINVIHGSAWFLP